VDHTEHKDNSLFSAGGSAGEPAASARRANLHIFPHILQKRVTKRKTEAKVARRRQDNGEQKRESAQG